MLSVCRSLILPSLPSAWPCKSAFQTMQPSPRPGTTSRWLYTHTPQAPQTSFQSWLRPPVPPLHHTESPGSLWVHLMTPGQKRTGVQRGRPLTPGSIRENTHPSQGQGTGHASHRKGGCRSALWWGLSAQSTLLCQHSLYWPLPDASGHRQDFPG